jgi:hypothetical protein
MYREITGVEPPSVLTFGRQAKSTNVAAVIAERQQSKSA